MSRVKSDMNNQGIRQPIRTSDPLQVLPPEIALQCLRESLPCGYYLYPSAGYVLPWDVHLYSSAVLELASVSKRWQDFILSAPTLWQEFHLHPELQDLFATVSTFIHFSGTASLDIHFWEDMRPQLPAICSMLLPYKNRIHRLVFKLPIRSGKLEHTSSCTMLMAAQFLGFLGYLPNLKEIDFGDIFQLNVSNIKPPSLPPTTRITNPFEFWSLMKSMGQTGFQHITNIQTSYHLDHLVPLLESSTNLAVLSVYHTSEIPPVKMPILITAPILKAAPSHLTTIYHSQDYCPNLGQLLKLSSSELTYLTLEIPVLRLEGLVENLKSMESLNVLTLVITHWEKTVPPISTVCKTTIATLHTLNIYAQDYGEVNSQQMTWLFEVFITLYPMVKRIKLSGPNDVLNFADQYLESLQSLEWMGVQRIAAPSRRILLSSLQSMKCNANALSYFDIPNPLSFNISEITNPSELDDLRTSNLRKLIIHLDLASDVDLNFDESQYANLHELEITLGHLKQRWMLSSFPQLTSIILHELGPFSPHGTRVCVSIIYNPEICPSLKHLRLSTFIGWDILFLMLQRRNCEATGVSKISSIGQEYVPLTLQPILSVLLEGVSVDVLRNDELGMEATREAICDPTIVGCLKCLKRMRPGCTATVENSEYTGYDVAGELLHLESPPPTIPMEIREWLVQYAKAVEKWKDSFLDFQSRYFRKADCTGF